MSAEHAFPKTFADLFAMVCSTDGLGVPFLLEEGSAGIREADSTKVVEVVFAP